MSFVCEIAILKPSPPTKLKIKIPTFLACLLFIVANTANATWQTLKPGLKYQSLSLNELNPFAHLHAFKIDLNRYHFRLALSEKDKALPNLAEIANQYNATIAINGGFFTPNINPLGLRVSNGKIRNPLKAVSWWGVFYIKANRAFITSSQTYYAKKKVDFAIQSGPRLIVNNHIPKLKQGKAQRSALGIDKDGDVILVASEFVSLKTETLAHIMKNKLFCHDALNLDGGSSSQLYAQSETFKKNVYGYANISDAILVVANTKK